MIVNVSGIAQFCHVKTNQMYKAVTSYMINSKTYEHQLFTYIITSL